MSVARADRGYIAALAAVVIWALVPVGTRFFVLRIDPYLFNVIRFAASGTAALPLFAYARPWRWRAQDRMLLLLCAALAVPGYNIPVALGARIVPAGQLGLLIATEPVFIIALTLLLQRKPIRRSVIVGSIVALTGVAVTSGIFAAPQSLAWASALQVLGGAASWSAYTVFAAPLNRRYGTFGVTGTILVVGSIFLMLLSLPMLHSTALPDTVTTMLLAGMGLSSSLLGFLLWNYAGAWVPTERLGLVLYLIPVVCVFAGAEFLGERLTFLVVAGGALTILGVWTASRNPPVPVIAISESAE